MPSVPVGAPVMGASAGRPEGQEGPGERCLGAATPRMTGGSCGVARQTSAALSSGKPRGVACQRPAAPGPRADGSCGPMAGPTSTVGALGTRQWKVLCWDLVVLVRGTHRSAPAVLGRPGTLGAGAGPRGWGPGRAGRPGVVVRVRETRRPFWCVE